MHVLACFHLRDTAGQERFRTLTAMNFRGTKVSCSVDQQLLTFNIFFYNSLWQVYNNLWQVADWVIGQKKKARAVWGGTNGAETLTMLFEEWKMSSY